MPRSKTDVYREGNFVFISASGSKYRPVGSTSSYTLRSGKISYTTCRDILRDTLTQLGYNPNDYGLHGLRPGGITAALCNGRNLIPERLLKIHGRWKSDSAKDMYDC